MGALERLRRAYLSLLFCALAASSWAATFPHLELKLLNDTSLTLPDDAHGQATILVIGFSKQAGTNAKPWIDRVTQDFGTYPSCKKYVIAVLADVPLLFRSFALPGTRNGVPEDKRSSYLVTFSDEKLWEELVGFQNQDDPYIVGLDRDGSVITQTNGAFSEKHYQTIAYPIRRGLSQKE
jgi:hypothetical protein